MRKTVVSIHTELTEDDHHYYDSYLRFFDIKDAKYLGGEGTVRAFDVKRVTENVLVILQGRQFVFRKMKEEGKGVKHLMILTPKTKKNTSNNPAYLVPGDDVLFYGYGGILHWWKIGDISKTTMALWDTVEDDKGFVGKQDDICHVCYLGERGQFASASTKDVKIWDLNQSTHETFQPSVSGENNEKERGISNIRNSKDFGLFFVGGMDGRLQGIDLRVKNRPVKVEFKYPFEVFTKTEEQELSKLYSGSNRRRISSFALGTGYSPYVYAGYTAGTICFDCRNPNGYIWKDKSLSKPRTLTLCNHDMLFGVTRNIFCLRNIRTAQPKRRYESELKDKMSKRPSDDWVFMDRGFSICVMGERVKSCGNVQMVLVLSDERERMEWIRKGGKEELMFTIVLKKKGERLECFWCFVFF